jgi:uncharacterized protein (TIGR02246 family)
MYRAHAFSVSGSSPLNDSESTIRGLAQDLCTAFNTGNYDQAAALYDSEASFMPPHQDAAQGPKSIERLLKTFGDQGYENLRFETTRVDSSGDMALETGHYTVTIRKGTTIVADHGKYLRGWRRFGAWRIVADCWSSNIRLGDDVRFGGHTKVA